MGRGDVGVGALLGWSSSEVEVALRLRSGTTPKQCPTNMSLFIYNTLTRKKEEFKPIHPPKVGLYVCGVTVYDECHLGHARALINFDVIYRYLKFTGYDVTFVRNFTDVDDKIIARAQKEKISWEEVATKYIATFHRDTKNLGLVTPSLEPKATEHIPDMLHIIQTF